MANAPAAAGQATPDPGAAPAATTTETPKGAAPATETPKPGTPAAEAPKGTEGAPAAPPKAADPPTATVPESYTLKAPKGAEVYVDDKLTATVAKVAKDNGWTQEEAQQALDEHVAALQAESKALRDVTEKDPDYGGEKLEETQQLARRAIDRVRPKGHARAEAFNALLERSGYGNHIEVVSFLADLGRLMQEDAPIQGAARTNGETSMAEKLYGKQAAPATE